MNGMVVNNEKTHLLNFKLRQNPVDNLQIMKGDHLISCKESLSFLGYPLTVILNLTLTVIN